MPFLGIAGPWETPAGEGWIAPRTPKVETPGGLITPAKAQPGDQTLPGTPPDQSSLPGGPSGGWQERYQAYQQGADPEAGVYEPPPQEVNVGQGGGNQPGDDLDAETIISGPPTILGVPSAAVAGPQTFMAGLGGALGVGLVSLLGSRFKAPWQTPQGEGFIAPWTQQQQLPSGDWGQEGVVYGGGGTRPGPGLAPGLAGLNYNQLKGGVPVKAWTNASRDGRIPATVAFVLFSNGMMASQSLIDGVIKTWRPKKHIVISRNPRLSNIRKLDKAHTRMEKTLRPYAKTIYRKK